MLKIEKFVTASPEQWEIIIEGMRNPMNSWGKMDSEEIPPVCNELKELFNAKNFNIGPNDHDLMIRLANGGPVHAKYRRMIPVYVTLTAPLYWWKEFDTYKVGTVANSCSTMHKIQAKEFTLEDFSVDHLKSESLEVLKYHVIPCLNMYRNYYLRANEKADWWQMIQLLPASYNQKRTVMLNYEVLHNIYISRKDHKLDEWHTFCDWIEELPYSELIIGET